MNSIIYRTKSWHARIWRRKTPKKVPVFEGSLKKELRFLNMFLLNTNLLHISVWRPQVSVQHWSFIKCFCSCTKFFPGYHHVPKGLKGLSPPPEAETSFFCGGYPGGPCLVLYRFWSPVLPLTWCRSEKGDFFWKEKGAKGDVHERNDDHGIYVCVCGCTKK